LFDVRKFIFLDEMGSNLSFTRLFGRAEPGQRVMDEVPGERGKNVSTIGALSLAGMITGLSIEGPINEDIMLYFVEEELAPHLRPGHLVLMDNVSIHKQDEIEEIIEGRGAFVLFLPTYSPDFNPIENCWSKIKARLRSLKPRTLDDLLDALTKAFSSITVEDIIGWFTHCGYQAAPI
jgi:transposase